MASPADDGALGLPINDRGQLLSACEVAEQPGVRQLYRVDVPPGAFVLEDAEAGQLVLPLRRPLRVLHGQAEIFPSHMTPWRIQSDEALSRRVRRAAADGGLLRVGFFLGFDDHRKQVCVVRPASGVTTVRADLAYLEVLGASGAVVVRESTERLRAWLDDRPPSADAGPAGASVKLMYAHVTAGRQTTEASPSWLRVLRHQVVQPAASCLAGVRDEGLPRELTMVVRWSVDAAGLPEVPTVQLSDLGQGPLDACVREALSSATFVPEPTAANTSLSVRLRFTP